MSQIMFQEYSDYEGDAYRVCEQFENKFVGKIKEIGLKFICLLFYKIYLLKIEILLNPEKKQGGKSAKKKNKFLSPLNGSFLSLCLNDIFLMAKITHQRMHRILKNLERT
jgi:hypothetical protein